MSQMEELPTILGNMAAHKMKETHRTRNSLKNPKLESLALHNLIPIL